MEIQEGKNQLLNKNGGEERLTMNCPKCNTEIIELKKRLPFLNVVVWLFLLIIPVFGWILIILDIGYYFTTKPDRCSVCDTQLKFDSKSNTYIKKGIQF